METIQVLDAASSAALLGATVAQADGVLYVVGGHDRGPQRPEDSDPWLRVTAIDAKRGDGRYWTPDSENTGLVNRFGHAAFMLRQELDVFGGEATDASRATLGRTDCGAVSGRGLTWRPNHPKDVGPAARSWAGHGVVAGMRERPVGLVHGGRGGDGKLFDDTWVLDPAESPAWAKLMTVGGKPPARFFHSLAPVGENARAAVVAGGMIRDREGTYVHANDDMWILDMTPAFIYSTPKPPEPEPEVAAAPAAAAAPEEDAKAAKGKKGKRESKVSKKKAPEPKKEKVVEKKKPVAEVERKREPAVWTRLARARGDALRRRLGIDPAPGRQRQPAGRRRREARPAVWTLLLLGGTGADGLGGPAEVGGLGERVFDARLDDRGFVEHCRWSDATWVDAGEGLESVPCGACAALVPLEAAPGAYVCGGADRAVMAPTRWHVPGAPMPTSHDALATCPSLWVQLGPNLANFAERRLAKPYEEPEEVLESGVDEGWGKQDAPDGASYEGQFVAGLRSGHGRMTYAGDGGVYDGEWLDDLAHGEGAWRGPPRDAFGEVEYEGEWFRGNRHGRARSTYDDGATFVGEYRDDHRHYGTLRLANGDVYVGQFALSGRDGDGTCDYHDTARYEGQWKDDLRHGDGSQVYADGAKYAGEWHGGRRNGTGDCLFASRDHYVGKWVADRRCGRGSCVYASGSKYDGEWKDDERHGAGVHVDDNGRYDGDWVKDREQGRGTWVGIGRPDHEKEYDGDWKAGGRHGAGASKYLDASHFDGQFRDDGRFHGTLCFANGDVYVGDFRDHKRHGGGRQTYHDGGAYDGQWARGKRHGVGTYGCPFERYTGEWAEDMRDGNGTWAGTRHDAEVAYEGDWRRDQRDGVGKSRDDDGATYEGDYVRDTRHRGVLNLANGDVYEGHFNASGRHGLGECAYVDGGTFVGEWANDKPDTDKGKWTGVPEVQALATTYKSQTAKYGFFSRSTSKKYAIVPV
ncbi:translation initiation factor IF-2 [Aureococcus anophagefferens]|nr:translation initiation factor IF-2 [Aureococcus anophagefferens]